MSQEFARVLREYGGLTPGRDGVTASGGLVIGGRPGEATRDSDDRRAVLELIHKQHGGVWENPPGLTIYHRNGTVHNSAVVVVERHPDTGHYSALAHTAGFETRRAELRRALGYPVQPAPGDNDALAAILAAIAANPAARELCHRAGRIYGRSTKNAAALAALKQELADSTGYGN